MSRTSDANDMASAFEEMHTRWAVDRVRSAVSKTSINKECVDCGDPIPQPRREAVPWATRCAYCQERHELQRR